MKLEIINGIHTVQYSSLSNNGRGVLVIPPLFDEKRSAHRAVTTFCDVLSQDGYFVIHPDLTGTGNSQGDMREMKNGQWIADINGIITSMKGYKITIIAIRAGALFAVNADLKNVKNMILCQPITNGANMIKQMKTRRMVQNSVTGEAPVIDENELDGEILSAELYAELNAISFPVDPPVDYKIVQFSFNTRVMAELQKLNTMWGGGEEKIKTYIHEPFWNSHSPGEYTELLKIITDEVI